MRTRPALLALAPALIAFTVAAPIGAQDEARLLSYGRHLAQECTGCHRVDGVDNGIPSIVGWDPGEFTKALEFYRTGARTNPVMVSVAQSLEAEQIRALASYYASLPKPARKR